MKRCSTLDGAQNRVPLGHGVRQNRATNVHRVVSHNLFGCLSGINLCNKQSASGGLAVQQGTGNDQVARLNLGGQVLAVSRTVLRLLLGSCVNVSNCVISHSGLLSSRAEEPPQPVGA